MKVFLLILVSFIFITEASGQKGNVVEIKVEVGRKRKIAKVDVEAADTALGKSIEKRLSNYAFPKKRPKKGSYLVKVAYIVAKDSSIAEVRCIEDPGYGMCAEAVRTIVKSVPWKPAPQNGRKVGTYRK